MFASGTITGATTRIARDDLPMNVGVISSGDGKVAASSLSLNNLPGFVVGGATTITKSVLTPNKIFISDVDGKVSTSQIITNI